MAGDCPGHLRGRPALGGRDHSVVAAAWRRLKRRMAADAGLKAEVEAPRVAILAAGRAPADTADPTLQQFALTAFDRARIAEAELARWRSANAALFAALEARGHLECPSAGRARCACASQRPG